MTTPTNSQDPFASVVTAKDVYDATRDTQTEVKAALTRLGTVEGKQADHERRIRSLEMWRYALPISALGSVGAAVAAIITAVQAGGI